MTIDSDGSLWDSQGTFRHFGRVAFEKLTSDFERCFVCGSSQRHSPFNDEHVIPDWILSRFGLHSARITLPNGQQRLYGGYKLRCCESCNSLLGSNLETPISNIFESDTSTTVANLQASDLTLLYSWLCLLFIKLHLKDREFRADPDRRNPSAQIGDMYDWDSLHHIHSVSRVQHSKATIDPTVRGTMYFFEMADEQETFDFGCLSDYSTVMLRIGSVGLAAVLNDCGYVSPLLQEYFSHITGPISSIQLREVAARLAYGNRLLKSRPKFWSELKPEGSLTIRSGPPRTREIGDVDLAELGELIAFFCEPMLRQSETPNVELKIQQLKSGKIQFLYHDDGSFISNTLEE